MNIVVTTVEKASTKTMRDNIFKRVIIDDASMIKETESFLATVHTE